jgi:SAM-dependent methyltransferase
MYNFKHLYGPEHFIPAPNSSNKFWSILFGYMEKYSKTGDSLLLVAEPKEVLPVFKEKFKLSKIDTLGYSGEKGKDYEVDLNIQDSLLIARGLREYNFVFSQALLEHICRPSIAIENMVDALKPEGYLILHTHNTEMPYHAFPIDCCRFYKDFFFDLCKYIDIEVVEYDEWGRNIFVCYRKLN